MTNPTLFNFGVDVAHASGAPEIRGTDLEMGRALAQGLVAHAAPDSPLAGLTVSGTAGEYLTLAGSATLLVLVLAFVLGRRRRPAGCPCLARQITDRCPEVHN